MNLKIRFSNVVKWSNMTKNRRIARQLVATRGDSMVARFLFELNRHYRNVGSSGNKGVFYGLKTATIKKLCDEGHLIDIEKHEQILPCWHTREFNNRSTDYCERCGGSDIYRVSRLYLFVFNVDDVNYSWHQLESDCKRWVEQYKPDIHFIQPTEWNRVDDYDYHDSMDDFNPDWMQVRMWALAIYAGKDVEVAYYDTGLIEALRIDIKRLWHGISYNIGFHVHELKQKIGLKEKFNEDEIPF